MKTGSKGAKLNLSTVIFTIVPLSANDSHLLIGLAYSASGLAGKSLRNIYCRSELSAALVVLRRTTGVILFLANGRSTKVSVINTSCKRDTQTYSSNPGHEWEVGRRTRNGAALTSLASAMLVTVQVQTMSVMNVQARHSGRPGGHVYSGCSSAMLSLVTFGRFAQTISGKRFGMSPSDERPRPWCRS
jgi:hypothetical protein